MKFIDVQHMRIPALGLGTWQLEGLECRRAVETALELGYRHIDTAAAYGNEAQVGAALRDCGIPRDDIHVTSKIWYEDLGPDRLLPAAREIVQRLGLSRVDLLLAHWPNPKVPLPDIMAGLQQVLDEGLASFIGVSNFPLGMLQEARKLAPIVCNQVECHPYLSQQTLLDYAAQHDMLLTAYSPLARGKVLDDRVLAEIGDKYGRTAGQVALRYQLQRGPVAVIPKATSDDHLRENFAVQDFELLEDEMQRIAELDRGQRLIDPSFAPDWDA